MDLITIHLQIVAVVFYFEEVSLQTIRTAKVQINE
jgi:hypothetical protein